jgi:hypothetical protein
LKIPQPLKKVRVDGSSGLNLYCGNVATIFHYKINFIAIATPIKVEITPLAKIVAIFQRLHHHQIFKQVSPQRITTGMYLGFESQKESCQPHVVEVQFGRFDESLGYIGMPWPEQKNDITGFQASRPRLCD